ncbi:MAG: hypothetical protein DRG78_01635, partial [Epsilonproteobacteria bacterium]
SILLKDYEIIGYGEGATLEEAKQISKSDISKMIQTKISSNINKKSLYFEQVLDKIDNCKLATKVINTMK